MQVAFHHHLAERIILEKLDHQRPEVAVGVSLQRQDSQSGHLLQKLRYLLAVIDVSHAEVVVKKRLYHLAPPLHHLVVLN